MKRKLAESSAVLLLHVLVGLFLLSPGDLRAAPAPAEIVARMAAFYERVAAYQAEVETSDYFCNLNTSPDFPEHFFDIEGEEPDQKPASE